MTTEPTTCPSCGAAVRVAGEGQTHRYEPIEPERATLRRLYRVLYDARADLRDAGDEVARLRDRLAAAERVVEAARPIARQLREFGVTHGGPSSGRGQGEWAHELINALDAVGGNDLEAGDGNG